MVNQHDLVLETDASVRDGNPGTGTWAYVALVDEQIIYEDAGFCPGGKIDSNNAEYWAAIRALEFARDLGFIRAIQLRSDALTMVRQMRDEYGYRSDSVSELSARMLALMEGFYQVDLIFIPRRFNQHADKLSKVPFASNRNVAMRRIRREDCMTMPDGWMESWLDEQSDFNL